MAKEEKQSDLVKLFGIDQETLDKSKDIKPVLELGKNMEDGAIIKIEFVDSQPKEVETPNSKFSKTSSVITVKDITNNENLEYSLFLSSKSLSLGIGRLWQEHNNDLKGVKAVIKKTKAVYKEFGENTAYNVQEIKE